MRLLVWVLVFCCAQLMLGREFALCSESPSVEELEKKAIAYRLDNIKQGEVRLHVINDHPPSEIIFDVTFDEKCVRQIRRYREQGKADWSKPEKIIVTPEKYIADHEDTDVPVVVQIASATDYSSPREHFGVINLQALGMTPNGASMLHVARVESLMNRSDRTMPEIHPDVFEGIDTWRINYDLKSPQTNESAKVAIWIAPSQGFSIVGIYYQADQDGKRYSTSINTQMKQYPERDVWYPKRLTKVQKEDDRITDRQEAIVEEARFGGAIDASAFTPAGLKLDLGRKTVDSTSGTPLLKVWDGKELTNPSSIETAPANPDRRRLILWILAAGLGLMAVFYLRRAIQQRKSTSSPGA